MEKSTGRKNWMYLRLREGDFQKDICVYKGGNEAENRGSKRWVEHFCASCMQKERSIKFHADKDGECPYPAKRGSSGVTIECKGPWDGSQILILPSGIFKPTRVIDGEIQVLKRTRY